jgi:hypothetical protein
MVDYCPLYSTCDITVAKDKLVAVAGIAKWMSARINRPYYAGIWGGEFLISGLLWTVSYDNGARRSPTYRGKRSNIFRLSKTVITCAYD